ncbi:MAG TPA: hypothetical protein VN345_12800 [Blastocatellia bacterium]|nr:hypothetical protein [Blastocatellia bacterium]
MADVKGVLLNAWQRMLEQRYGDDRVAKAKAALDAKDRGLLPLFFLDSNWYAFDALNAMRKLTRSLAERGEKNLSVEIGRCMAEGAFSGAYRSMMTKDPIKQVGKFSQITDFFFREARTLETETVGEHGCIVRYRYNPSAYPSRGMCQSLIGFWSRVLEMAGASDVTGSHTKCSLNGADCCEFVLNWR